MSVGNPIKHAAIHPAVLATIKEFDSELRERKWKERDEIRKVEYALKQAKRDEEAPERRAKYQSYLNSAEWWEKRNLVIDREQGVCQGCRKALIREVHHTTYANIGNEALYELIGLCEPCHRKAHPEHNS